MKVKKIYVGLFDWNVKVIEVESHDEEEIQKVKKIFRSYINDNGIKKFLKYLNKWKAMDGGVYVRLGTKDSFIMTYPVSSEKKRKNILLHELYHCVTDISETLGLRSEETEAYLISYLTDKII